MRIIGKGEQTSVRFSHNMLINEGIAKFALMFKDGTVLTTSDDLQKLFVRHF